MTQMSAPNCSKFIQIHCIRPSTQLRAQIYQTPKSLVPPATLRPQSRIPLPIPPLLSNVQSPCFSSAPPRILYKYPMQSSTIIKVGRKKKNAGPLLYRAFYIVISPSIPRKQKSQILICIPPRRKKAIGGKHRATFCFVVQVSPIL